MASTVRSFTLSGIEGHVVEVETDVLFGPPSVSIVGLGERPLKRPENDWKQPSYILISSFHLRKSSLIWLLLT